jgi:chromosome segregation ATPase
MNRTLQFLNLFGVLAVAALCVVQWQNNRRLNLDANQLEKTRQVQQQKISEQEETARGLTQDLARFKEQVKALNDDLGEAKTKSRETENVLTTMTADRNRLADSITNWINAVAQRDALAKEANSRIEELSTQLNASIQKFNELATNYNSVVKDLNDARAKSSTTNSP